MGDERTHAEQEAAKQILAAYLKRRQDEQDARGPNPRYPAGTMGQGHGDAEAHR